MSDPRFGCKWRFCTAAFDSAMDLRFHVVQHVDEATPLRRQYDSQESTFPSLHTLPDAAETKPQERVAQDTAMQASAADQTAA
ncbi:hypothetical protein ACM66B_002136 [Microbotryomycetes sp. NB124-2]